MLGFKDIKARLFLGYIFCLRNEYENMRASVHIHKLINFGFVIYTSTW